LPQGVGRVIRHGKSIAEMIRIQSWFEKIFDRAREMIRIQKMCWSWRRNGFIKKNYSGGFKMHGGPVWRGFWEG